MDNSNYFKELLESISDYRKIVFLMFLIKNDKDLLYDVGFSERDINHSKLEFKNILTGGYDEYLEYNKNEEESKFEKILSIQMKDFTHKRVLLLLSLTDLDIFSPSILLYKFFLE